MDRNRYPGKGAAWLDELSAAEAYNEGAGSWRLFAESLGASGRQILLWKVLAADLQVQQRYVFSEGTPQNRLSGRENMCTF